MEGRINWVRPLSVVSWMGMALALVALSGCPATPGTERQDAGAERDASAEDAGAREDAGAQEDAGLPEDAGAREDAGAVEDAGAQEDAGSESAHPRIDLLVLYTDVDGQRSFDNAAEARDWILPQIDVAEELLWNSGVEVDLNLPEGAVQALRGEAPPLDASRLSECAHGATEACPSVQASRWIEEERPAELLAQRAAARADLVILIVPHYDDVMSASASTYQAHCEGGELDPEYKDIAHVVLEAGCGQSPVCSFCEEGDPSCANRFCSCDASMDCVPVLEPGLAATPDQCGALAGRACTAELDMVFANALVRALGGLRSQEEAQALDRQHPLCFPCAFGVRYDGADGAPVASLMSDVLPTCRLDAVPGSFRNRAPYLSGAPFWASHTPVDSDMEGATCAYRDADVAAALRVTVAQAARFSTP